MTGLVAFVVAVAAIAVGGLFVAGLWRRAVTAEHKADQTALDYARYMDQRARFVAQVLSDPTISADLRLQARAHLEWTAHPAVEIRGRW